MKNICTFLFIFLHLALSAQELFPQNEPASSIPKGVLGVRTFGQTYKEVDLLRNMFGIKLMYGLLPKLSIMGTATVSNHHGRDLPAKLVSHKHVGNQTIYSTGNFQRGQSYPYLFSGIHLYAKYRFLTLDGEQEHLRMAGYAEWSNVNVAHDETEPNLMDDTKGYGGGIILTYLKNHFAISLTTGAILPGAYEGLSPDSVGPKTPTRIEYGKALMYNLSLGYLLFPRQYSDYKQTNLNLYMEFTGKAFQEAKVTQFGHQPVPIQTPLLKAGNYIEAHPGIQVIFNSNLRCDLSVGFPLVNKSYARFYPLVNLGFQRYFYLRQ